MDARLDGIDARLNGIDTRLDGLDTRLVEMDRRIADGVSETRRHFDVVAEQHTARVSVLVDALVEAHASDRKRLLEIESERPTLLSALSDHELRLRVLEGTGRKPL